MDKHAGWKVMEKYLRNERYHLVTHHLESYDVFIHQGISSIIQERNPTIVSIEANTCKIYMGGKDGTKIYHETKKQYIFPNEARIRNRTYSFPLHMDVFVEYFVDNALKESFTIEKMLIGKFPIMLHSNMCILHGLNRELIFNMGECRNDPGGYFIIEGKEKVMISQETFADNVFFTREHIHNNEYSYSIEMTCKRNDFVNTTSPISLHITRLTNNVVVSIPEVDVPIPLFILFRAFGFLSDKTIIEMCFVNEINHDFFIPSIHDTGLIFTQQSAIRYISNHTKDKSDTSSVLKILTNHVFPHISNSFKEKAFYLGYMTRKLLRVYLKKEKPTDWNHLKNKRIETSGKQLTRLFDQGFHLFQERIRTNLFDIYKTTPALYQGQDFFHLVQNNATYLLSMEEHIMHVFQHNVKNLTRQSFHGSLSQRREIIFSHKDDNDHDKKKEDQQALHGTHWGLLDPIDTPIDINIGFSKQLSLMTIISHTQPYALISITQWLSSMKEFISLSDATSIDDFCQATKIFVNGIWVGIINTNSNLYEFLLDQRRRGNIHYQTSIYWNSNDDEIEMFTDAGRLMRPLFYLHPNRKPSFIHYKTNDSWKNMMSITKQDEKEKQVIIEYLDVSESNNAFISLHGTENFNQTKHTHIELHPSTILGVVGNQLIYPENNGIQENVLGCAHLNQGISLYHTNFHNRMDVSGNILHYGQTPIIKSQISECISYEENPYGENVIVAVMVYNGMSMIINKSAIDRGLFRKTCFTSYETEEYEDGDISSTFSTVSKSVCHRKEEYEYSSIEKEGIIRENTKVHDKKALIGKINYNKNTSICTDSTLFPVQNQKGYVDRIFSSTNERGTRFAKVRIREEHVPIIGDMISPRCGKKEAIGLVLAEIDMPITSDGQIPDIIIHPDTFASSLKTGQLLEILVGKSCSIVGGYGNTTAFSNENDKMVDTYGSILVHHGYHSSGKSIVYNGMTGEQLSADIFIGPCFYMCLEKEDKKKKDNMIENDVMDNVLIGLGASTMVQEYCNPGGTTFRLAICNKTGMTAIYNETEDLFLSPMADGPISFKETAEQRLLIKNVSRFGRDFSIICISPSFKSIIQYFTCMNVQMRIITEDNINQIESMSFSQNIDMLLHLDHGKNNKERYSAIHSKQLGWYNMSRSKEQKSNQERIINVLPEPPTPVPDEPTRIITHVPSPEQVPPVSSPPEQAAIIPLPEPTRIKPIPEPTLGSEPDTPKIPEKNNDQIKKITVSF